MPYDWWLRKLQRERAIQRELAREEWERENELSYHCRECGELLDDALPRKIAYCRHCRKKN
jgi:hypothetical protein